ncbi:MULTISPECIES: GNAT family N-acetyltransferase [Brevibacillus]|uniref:GNAT family N-acetyltransferase n=1 Tax=Brevibacillus invocatus TaxID=173959 RepID=A0A3M8BMH1_9BACL|nr:MULTISPECIES: GNAT family N-acetyltransferase [Brevibacillus]MCM3081799.1 GNAT family N-acetyltransferase [Brevibacillus invocatus]MCM3432207.1 GNAT family N-acetyltransferase [Brevibacillus invocatus]MDH4620012.1 GNAT family N-acetyltransferase [Brevibacillus sp. AY1]RNB64588.1 GNAT family N-acetyltransferase [Brevibacillus invocatus]
MITIRRTSPDSSDFNKLVEMLDKDLWKRYPQTQQQYAPHNRIALEASVVLAYEADRAVGCGCYRQTDDPGIVEIKRMFVMEEARGKGIAKQILKELEAWAVEEGNTEAKLETGTRQPEAVALYTQLGYKEISKYGPYVDLEESICMGKKL